MRKDGYNIKKYEHSSQKLTEQFNFLPQKGLPPCMCRLKDNISSENLSQCPRCNQYLHYCLLPEKTGRDKEYIVGRCCYCIARFTDPSSQVVKTINEGYFNIKDCRKMAYHLTWRFEMQLPIPDGHYVEVRCFYAGDHQVTFPMLGTLYLNKQQVKVFKPLLYNSNLKRRKDENIRLVGPFENVNELEIKIPRIEQKKIENQFKFQNRSPFFLSIFLLKELDFSGLQKKIINSSYITQQQSCSKFFSTQIQAEKQILKCPFSFEFIKIPIRGQLCTHFQVFCFQSFYSVSKGNSKWSCPICKKKTYIPVLDTWIRDILNEIKNLHIRDQDQIEVIFYRDGNYSQQIKRKDEEKEKQKEKELIRLKKQHENPKKRRSCRLKEKTGPTPINQLIKIDLKEEQLEDKIEKGKRPNEIVLDDLDELAIIQQTANQNNQPASVIDEDQSWQEQLRELSHNVDRKAEQMQPEQPESRHTQIVEVVQVDEVPKKIQQPIPVPIPEPPKKKLSEFNSHIQQQMANLKIDKVAVNLQSVKCQNMHSSDLIKIFNSNGKNKSKRIKQLTDEFPNLFSNF